MTESDIIEIMARVEGYAVKKQASTLCSAQGDLAGASRMSVKANTQRADLRVFLNTIKDRK